VKVVVRLFAQMRLSLGQSRLDLELPEGASLAQALAVVYDRYPVLRELAPSCMVSVGLDYAEPARILREADEISIIPPVQGG
jgi:sulfur-carrier protein